MSDSDYDEEEEACFPNNCRRPNVHGRHHHRPNNLNQKFLASPLEECEGMSNIAMSNTVTTRIGEFIRDMAIGRSKKTDKALRATVEKVLDCRTTLILWKLMNVDVFKKIDGCISTGKEAHVYYAIKSNGQELAIKVFKTSVLDFKDRDRYVQGDFRFQRGYCKKNPRKMMQVMAQKEMRNLKRLEAAGIKCPTVHHVKYHILIMDFIGKRGCAADRLSNAATSLDEDQLRKGYKEIIIAMRKLYQEAKLVHADLSEYNILYFEGHLYVIDVSQSVDLSHPSAYLHLCDDCIHVSHFFRRRGVAVMTIEELFNFIVDDRKYMSEEDVDSVLAEVQDRDIFEEDEFAIAEFVQNVEADVIRLTSREDTEDMNYKTILGQRQALPNALPAPPETELDDSDSADEEKSGDSDSDSDEGNSGDSDSSCVIQAHELLDKKAARKENKKRVKEENREKRKHKLPKAEKKRRKKMAKSVKTR